MNEKGTHIINLANITNDDKAFIDKCSPVMKNILIYLLGIPTHGTKSFGTNETLFLKIHYTKFFDGYSASNIEILPTKN